MPNINITDSRKRDAVVKAENTGIYEEVRYVDSDGSVASTRKVLKATVAHDFDTLNDRYGEDPQKLGYALIEGDPEVDMERCGVFLWGVSKVYVTSDDGIVYRIEQTEKVMDAQGEVKETRPRRRAEANVDAEIPLTWTGRKIKKPDAIKRFVFSSKLQIVHVNGLTYDFLFGMANELAGENSLMMVGGGGGGKDPLVFRRGSVPYRGFLEGRVDGDQYILLLHLSNMELKVPESIENSIAAAADVTADQPADSKASRETATEPETKSKAKTSKKKIKTKTSKVLNASADSDDSVDTPVEPEAKVVVKHEAQIDKGETKQGDEKEGGSKQGSTKQRGTEQRAAEQGDKLASGTDKTLKEASKKSDSTKKAKAKPSPSAEGDETESQNSVQQPIDEAQIGSEDLGVWLKSIRMGKYLGLFVENEIDVDVLTELTDDDLKELDIPLGSRRRLLKAVAEADNLRAEVVKAVSDISKASTGTQSAKKKKTRKKKTTRKDS